MASATVTLTVGQDTMALALAVSNPSPTLGTAITLTATATSDGETPGGRVRFFSGATLLGSGVLSGGVAVFTTGALTVGSQSVTAVYRERTDFAGATSNAVTVTVGCATPTLTLSESSTGSGALGDKFTFTAAFSNSVKGTKATGSISFTVDGVVVASDTLATTKTIYSTIALTVGPHTIIASFSGDANYLGISSNVVTVNVAEATPTVKLTASSLSVKSGVLVTFTATLNHIVTGVAPTGSIGFYDGGSQLGIETLSSGPATYSTSTLSVGVHTITAVYSGDSNYQPATSSNLSETVKKN
jgi:hypothetical protein